MIRLYILNHSETYFDMRKVCGSFTSLQRAKRFLPSTKIVAGDFIELVEISASVNGYTCKVVDRWEYRLYWEHELDA